MLPHPLVAALALAAPGVDLSELSSDQQRVFESVAAEEFCNCGSALTLAGCLELRPDCKVAGHLGRMVARMAAAGVTSDEILAYLSDRVMGPFCSVTSRFDVEGAPSKGPKN